jgi:protein-disulfide isomerase
MTFYLRQLRMAFGALVCAVTLNLALPNSLHAQSADVLSRENILQDPEIPSLGNPKGDVTIVEYFDYQCSYCKAISPELSRLASEDGKIRIVLKDWPIFGEESSNAAKLVLAAKYQDKYQQAHDALISARGRLTGGRVEEILKNAGVDVAQAKKDLETNRKSIDALLVRNNAQAEGLGFEATPSFIVGTYRYPGAPPMEHLKQMIADVRAGKNK